MMNLTESAFEASAKSLTDSINAYIGVPATAPRPVLTHCAICAHPLTDAASVEIGIGPVCRERVEYDRIPEALRKKANQMIAEAAANLKDRAALMVLADAFREMGLDKLGAAIMERFATVTIVERDDVFYVKTPYEQAFALAMRRIGAGRAHVRGSRIGTAWVLEKTWNAAFAVREALAANFAGCVGKVVGGESFWIGGAT